MNILRLRTMARKSIFNAGLNEGLSVQQLLDLKKQTTLVYNYYNYSKISYLPDILKELGIVGKFVIQKPGKNLELFKEWKNWFYGNMEHMEKIIRHSIRKKGRKTRLKNKEFKIIKKSKASEKHQQRKRPITFTGKLK